MDRWGLTKGRGLRGHDASLKKGSPKDWLRDFKVWREKWRGDDEGHTEKMKSRCKELEKYLKATCPMEKALYEELLRQMDWCRKRFPVPLPVPEEDLQEIKDDDALKSVATGAAVIGGGYLIYRGVRLLPSLLPPLWWTLPVNFVAP